MACDTCGARAYFHRARPTSVESVGAGGERPAWPRPDGAARAQLACARRARARVGRDAPFRAAAGRRATAWSARARRSRACAAGAARGEPGALVRARAMGSCTSSANFCTLLSRASRGAEQRRARQACPEVVFTSSQCAQGPIDPRKGCCHSGPLDCPCGCSRSQIVTRISKRRPSCVVSGTGRGARGVGRGALGVGREASGVGRRAWATGVRAWGM